jgi:hypothetical protein
MRKYIKEHINFIQNILQKENTNFDWHALSDFNKTQIKFFQHERLIHLLITLFFGLIFFVSIMAELLILNTGNNPVFSDIGLSAVNAILIIILIFYILHYFFLENSIQKLYRLNREIIKHCEGNYTSK